ncbi:MAG: two-component system NtrC family sensor kinase [Kiritimatiellia bacterium]|jgi:two-component system NtrC family sensor kinase
MQEDLHTALFRLNRILDQASQDPVIDGGHLGAAMVNIVDSLHDGLGVSRVSIWQLDDDDGLIRCLLLRDEVLGLCRDPMELREEDFPFFVDAVRRARVIAAHDPTSISCTAQLYEGYLSLHGVESLLCAPIRRVGEVVGVLCAEHQGSPRTWTIAETTFIGVMADLVARSISGHERQQARAELEATNAALEGRVRGRTQELQSALDSLKMAQEQLVDSEKFAALGSLVAGVAHEINTPVGVAVTALSHMTDSVAGLRSKYEDGVLSKTSLETFLHNADRSCELLDQNLRRAADLVRSFKQVAVNQTSEVHATFFVREELNNVLIALNAETRRRHVQVDLQCAADLQMTSYPGPVAQLMTNLVMNSLLHGYDGRDGGLIRIDACRYGEQIVLCYSDDGCGIPREHLRKVFEPFFTTRRGEGGTGLGLHIVYNLVYHKLGGKLELASDEGRGVHYRIVLPVVIQADVSDPLIHAA